MTHFHCFKKPPTYPSRPRNLWTARKIYQIQFFLSEDPPVRDRIRLRSSTRPLRKNIALNGIKKEQKHDLHPHLYCPTSLVALPLLPQRRKKKTKVSQTKSP